MSDRKISVYAENRSFTVIPHVLVWDWGKRQTHELLFASYVGIPEAVKAVTACILEGREIRVKNQGFIRNGGDPYRRVEKPMGMGDVAHGSVYSSLFELAAIESQEKADEFNRALIFAPDGDLEKAVVSHAMSRFGLPEVWKDEYYPLIRSDVYSLRVDVHPDLAQWKNAKAAIFSGTEVKVIEAISYALKRGELSIPSAAISGAFNPDWTMTEYLVNNAEHLGRQLAEKKPRHTFDAPLDPSIADLKRIPFPIQAHMIQAIANTLGDKKNPEAIFMGGDMGSGSACCS
jgi:hypothetical protein